MAQGLHGMIIVYANITIIFPAILANSQSVTLHYYACCKFTKFSQTYIIMCRKSSTFLSIARFDRAFRYVSATILQKFSHTQLRRFSATLGNIDAGIIFLSLAQHFGKNNQSNLLPGFAYAENNFLGVWG